MSSHPTLPYPTLHRTALILILVGKETVPQSKKAVFASAAPIKLVAIDMDGTLLDSNSRVLPSSVEAIKAALATRSVTMMLATGKARPAAMTAMRVVGLAGDGLLVGPRHPGLFLQGLAVHSLAAGELIGGGVLSPSVVCAAFEYALATSTPICGFLGDTCVTIGSMTPEILELHERFYEPLATVAPSVEHIVQGPPMRKLLFMTNSHVVSDVLKPYWDSKLSTSYGGTAMTMQAVPDMLEIVPRGHNKFVGLQVMLAQHGKSLESQNAATQQNLLSLESVMAIGDGGNELELVAGVGVGVAMGNAVPAVKEVATAVVASNDEGGVAEAIEKFIL